MTYGGEPINIVFTTPTGGLVLRQAVAKVVKQAATTAGIAADLGMHAGRRGRNQPGDSGSNAVRSGWCAERLGFGVPPAHTVSRE